MEDDVGGPFTPSTPDFGLMDELLGDGFWLEAPEFFQPQETSLNVSENNPSSCDELSSSLWFGPNRNLIGDNVPVKTRLVQAIDCIRHSTIDKDVLIQIWIPVNRGDKQVLTTNDQPFTLNPLCKNLADYRNVSENYHFLTDAESKEFYGLPGRVFLNKVPDWTPDVRFFQREEYPRVGHAQKHDVRGSLALPVFERGSGVCLGVVEIVTTSQKVDFSLELENVCKALEAVNLKSSNILSHSDVEDPNESYHDGLAELRDVLKFICDAHNLPLAQTWAPCVQQRKGGKGCRHSQENNTYCLSTVDSACYVSDEWVSGFHEACSGYHLLMGEGVVGNAFLTKKTCFSNDVTAYSKTEYPLSHHARVFGLGASGAIYLRRSMKNGTGDDFVLEFFFLPQDCSKEDDDRKMILDSFSSAVREKCQSLRVITDTELALETSAENESYLNKGKGIANVSLSNNHKKDSKVESKIRSERRQMKTKKTISLEILRQYYGCSLKEAAMGIGVCPTTLKRICRHHGITRWPSRKMKKVDHSLKKLQLVIDSVQGVEGSIQLSSFYNDFPELVSAPNVLPGSSHFKTLKNYHSVKYNQPEGPTALVSHTNPIASKSASMSCSSIGVRQSSIQRTQSEAQMHEEKTKLLMRTNSHKHLGDNSSVKAPSASKNSNPRAPFHGDQLKVKAGFGEERVKFSLQPQWGLKDLQQKVFGRFNVENGSSFNLKYLDDDDEWMLLTCDDDLEECKDIHLSSNRRTIKISVNQRFEHPHLENSFASYGSQ